MSLGSYGARHTQAALGSLGRLARSPFGTLLTTLVIALALSLPLALKLLVSNARDATGNFANAVDLSVYFKLDTPIEKAQQLASSARSRADVAQADLIPADAALEEFRQHSGFGTALEALEGNPLPHVLHVQPTADSTSPGDLERLRGYFAAWPEVELVQIDSDWVMRFNAMLDLVRRVLALTMIALGLGIVAIVGNTVRLEIANRRSEIEVVKLIGGSNGFVRRPFLYTGVFYGIVGGLLAWGLLVAAITVLAEPVDRLATLYGSRFTLRGPTPEDVGALIVTGLLLGWLGAWLSASRHLRAIEPRA
jgi:cell division transport system permease protein